MNDLIDLSETELLILEQKTRASEHELERLIKKLERTKTEIDNSLLFLKRERIEKGLRNDLVMKELIKRRKGKDGLNGL